MGQAGWGRVPIRNRRQVRAAVPHPSTIDQAVWAHVGFLAGLGFAVLLTRPKPGYRPYYADEGILGFNPQGYR